MNLQCNSDILFAIAIHLPSRAVLTIISLRGGILAIAMVENRLVVDDDSRIKFLTRDVSIIL